MKKLVLALWVLSLIFSFTLPIADVSAKEKAKKEAAVVEDKGPLAKGPAQKEEAKLIYTFKDDKEIDVFKQLYVQKQLILNRIAVLQAYLGLEMRNLDDINGQLSLKFKMDPDKNYNLDEQKKILEEIPASMLQQMQQQPGPAPVQ